MLWHEVTVLRRTKPRPWLDWADPAAHTGRLFRGVRGGILSESTYGRVRAKARVIALTDAQAASTLAKHPYDLRHACVSTWLRPAPDPSESPGGPVTA